MKFGLGGRWVISLEVAREQAWIMYWLFQPNVLQGCTEYIIPVMRTAAQAIQGLVEKPIVSFAMLGISDPRDDTVSSSGGSLAWQNAFLQSLCCKTFFALTTLEHNRRRELYFNTGV
jgi:hypothetical protein